MALIGFDRQLTWSDFQKKNSRPSGKAEDAETFTFANATEISVRRENDNFRVKSVKVTIGVTSSKNWVVNTAQTASLLKHEQGHYDIHALGAREIHQKFMEAVESAQSALSNALRVINDQVQATVDAANERYDAQTNHGQNKSDQQTWDAKFSQLKTNPNGTLDQLP